MKKFTIIILLIEILSCQQTDKQQQTKPTTYLVINNLNYFVYAWYYPTGKWEFYLDRYVNVDKNGHFKLMLRDDLQKSKYFTGIINDTIAQLIDQTFSSDTFKINYKSDSIQNIAYNGYTYCFDYKIEKAKQNKKVQFIQSRSPEPIKTLSIQLENLLLNSNATQVDTLDIATSIEEFEKFSAAFLGEPPKIEKAKFNSISIRP